MALLFCDGMRHYSADARIAEKWTATNGSYSATGGRGNGASITLAGLNADFIYYILKTLPSSYATLGCGFRFKQATAFSSTSRPIVAFRDAGTGQFCIGVNGSGNLQAYKGDYSTTIGSASSNALNTDTLYYIEVKALIHGSAGTIEVRVNGTATGWLSLTGVDTQASANATANQVILGNAAANARYFCDVVIWDTSGSYNTDFLGEVNVDAYLPDGAGNYAQLTPSTGSNYACVDETTPNTTDYVSSGTNGHIDTYTFADMIGNNPQIKAVVNNLWALKTDSGTIYAKSKYRRGGTDYTGSNITPSTVYQCLQNIYEVDPATSAAWVKGNVNGSEFGVEVSTS